MTKGWLFQCRPAHASEQCGEGLCSGSGLLYSPDGWSERSRPSGRRGCFSPWYFPSRRGGTDPPCLVNGSPSRGARDSSAEMSRPRPAQAGSFEPQGDVARRLALGVLCHHAAAGPPALPHDRGVRRASLLGCAFQTIEPWCASNPFPGVPEPFLGLWRDLACRSAQPGARPGGTWGLLLVLSPRTTTTRQG